MVWTNDEGDGGETITSKGALDAAIASGSTSGMPEALAQLDELVLALGASAGA